MATEQELRDAVANVSEPEITLTDDIALTSTLTITRNLVLDLNGHSLTADGFRAIHVTSGENVVITSATPALISVSGSIADNSSVIRVGGDSGDSRNIGLTLEQHVTVSTDKCYGITVFGTNTKETLVVNGTVATTTVAASAISGNGDGKYRANETSITIGETAHISAANDVAIYHPQAGTLTVNGTVTGLGGIEMKAGTLIIGDEAKITATGAISHSVSNDGTSTRGYAIAIVENEKYAGVSTVKISNEAKITGTVATVFDSTNSTTANVDFSESAVKLAVEIIGGGKYMNFADALKACTGGETLKLLENVALTETATIDKNLTLDLDGHTITSAGQRAFHITKGDVAIKSTNAGGTIDVPTCTNNDMSVIRVGSNESAAVSLTVEKGVTISADECYGITIFGKNTSETLTVNGNVNTKIRPAISGNGSAGLASTNITIGSTANITTTDEVTIYQPQAGTLTVNGTVTGSTGIEIKGGSLTVGATANIKATGTPTHTSNNDGTSSRGYSIAIVENNGGYGNGAGVTAVSINNDAKLTGPVAQLQDSPITDFNPTYTGNAVGNKVAAIGDDEYFKLTDAFDIVTTNGTVKLLQDVTLSETFVMDREITSSIDLAGHTLTGSGCTAVAITNGHVTITSTADSPNGTVTSTGTGAVIQLGDDDGDKRATSLTIGENVDVTTITANGINVAGSKTRETLTVYGNVTTTGKPAIIGSGDAEKGGTTITIAPSSTITTSDNVAIYHPQSGELMIDGKVIGTGTTAGAIEMKGGDLTVAAGATVTATGTAEHNPDPIPSLSNDVPSTNGYAIAIVENADFSGVGKVFIDKTATVTGVIATLIDSENNKVAEPEFNGDIYMLAEVMKTETRGEKYSKLKDAVAAAVAGETVRLLDYITLTEALTIDKNITLNFDVYDITGNQASGAVIAVSNGATIKNGGIITAQQGISITGGTVNLQQLDIKADAGSLAISGGTVTADKASAFTSSSANTVAISNGAVVTINGKVENTGAYAAIAATGSEAATALTINSGATVTSTGKGIDWESAGTLTIKGGKMTGTDAVYANAGTVTINAGTFTGAGSGYAVNIVGSTCNPTVKHGTFYCEDAANPIVADSKTGFVEGDYFNKAIAQDLCAPGYMISDVTNNNKMFYLISELVITDATVWNAPGTTYTIKKAKYVRNSGMGTTAFGTLCLPFAFSATQTGMTFYSVNRISGNTLYLDAITGTTIAAGTPVIFKRTGDDPLATSFTIEENNAEIKKALVPTNPASLKGTFQKKELSSADDGIDLTKIYYLNGDHFHQADEKITVPAFRAYIDSPTVSSVKVLNIICDDEVDAIEAVQLDGEMQAVYDLQGRKQNGLQPGMNIIKMTNGKTIKVMVK